MSQNVRRNLIATITPAAGQDLTLEMIAAARITTASTGTIATLVGHGGKAPYNYSIASGTIPGGTALDAVTGKINVTGALTQGTYTFVAQVDDSSTPTSSSFLHAFSITIATRLTATATQPPAITLNFNPPAPSTNYQFVFAATGNVGPLTWAIVSGAAPAGLTIVGSGVNAGRLGTATTVTSVPNGGAAYTFTVRATDSTTLETLDIPVVLWVYAAQTGAWNDYKNISGGVWAYPFNTTLPPVEQGRTRTYRFTTVRGRGQPPFTWTWGGHASLTPFVTLSVAPVAPVVPASLTSPAVFETSFLASAAVAGALAAVVYASAYALKAVLIASPPLAKAPSTAASTDWRAVLDSSTVFLIVAVATLEAVVRPVWASSKAASTAACAASSRLFSFASISA